MSQTRILLEIQFFSLASGLLYFLLKANPLALAPLLAYILFRALPIIQGFDYRSIIIFLAGLALFVDDISQVAWGRNIEMPTEILGKILFESFGVTGLELISCILLLWIILNEKSAVKLSWLRDGLLGLGFLISSYFLSSFVSALIGLFKGGDLNVHFIQSRFLHILPIWTILGFMAIDRWQTAIKLLNVIAVVMTLKSVQAVLSYLLLPRELLDSEYLVDHYFSMFSVITLVYTACLLLFRQQSILLRAFLLLGTAPVFLAYIFNQRRTSFVAAAFALSMLPFFFKKEWYRKHRSKLLIFAVIVTGFVGVSWFLPPPFSFLKTTFESLQEESSMEDPSYRALENGNLLHAIGSAPILGLGSGQEFEEVFRMPDISFVYDRYRMIPHNLLLAAWAYGGLLGILSLSLIFVFMISRSGALIRQAIRPEILIYSICSFFFLLQYIVYTYGDLGLQIPRNQMFSGLLFGGVCRLLANNVDLSASRSQASEYRPDHSI